MDGVERQIPTDATSIADSQPRGLDADFLAVIEQVRRNSEAYFASEKAKSSWEDAVRAMEDSPQGIETVRRMAAERHRPMVYHETPQRLYIGTGLTLPPDSSLGSAYNAAAGAEIDKNNQKLLDSQKVRWEGTAVDRVAAMGAGLMPAEHWEKVKLLRFYDPNDKGLEATAQARWSFLDSSQYLPKPGEGTPSVVMTVVVESSGLIRALAQTSLLAGAQVGFHCFTSFEKRA